MNTQNIKTIFTKELKSYFNSPIAYIVMIVFMAISGFLFTMSFFQINIASMREFFGSFFIQLVLFVVFIPAITMRSFSEEKKQGTLELLLTKPITDIELILGKYLSALTLIVITLSPTILYFIIIKMIGPIDFWPFLTSLLGYILMSAFFIGIGVFVSSLTENQIIAFIVSVLICLFFFLFGKLLMVFPSSVVSFFEYLTTDYHLSNISRGVIDSRVLIYYFSMIFFTIFLTKVSLESRKW
ncbi:MAG TPA: ABC transporter permease subunit [Ignavibacteria bacterium]|nr:ABC transporter permease subunit [Ignavibacteria bacterium]HMQ98318.1 ABC transporter permease subunit [Ignavibacteria bacterium]